MTAAAKKGNPGHSLKGESGEGVINTRRLLALGTALPFGRLLSNDYINNYLYNLILAAMTDCFNKTDAVSENFLGFPVVK